MKKQLACPEYKIGLALQSTESITIFVEPENLGHSLQLATEILKLINRCVETKAKEHTVTLDQLKKASQTTLPETFIETIEKFQNFYSRPAVLTLPYRRFTFSLQISPYELALMVNILSSVLVAMSFYLLASEVIGGKAISIVNDFAANSYTKGEFNPEDFKKDFFKKDISASYMSSDVNNLKKLYIADIWLLNIVYSLAGLFNSRPYDFQQDILFYYFYRAIEISMHLHHMIFFGNMVILNPEISLDPMAYPKLSSRFDKIMQHYVNHVPEEVFKRNSIAPPIDYKASIQTYCALSSIAILGTTVSSLFLIINNIGVLERLKELTQLIQKSISAQEPVLKNVAYEKTNLETWIERSSAELLQKGSEQNLTAKDKEELDQTIKKLAMKNLIEMLEKTSNPPHDTSGLRQRSTEALLNQKIIALLTKVKTEYATKENSHHTVETKFENIARTIEDFTIMEVPLFPVLHLEAGKTVFGIRELTGIQSCEVRMPKDPDFQETEKDRNHLNTLIKQLLRGETGYINDRSTTLLEYDPRIEAYPIQFSKELFPAFLFLRMIQEVIEGIEEIEALPTSALNSQSLSRRPAARGAQERVLD